MVFFSTIQSSATNFFTTAGGTGPWNNASNWVGGAAGRPGNNTGYSNYSGPSNDTVFIDHPIYTELNFELGGAFVVVVIRSGGSLSINTSDNLNLNRSEVIVTGGTLNVTGNFTTQNPSPITISNNGTINVSGNMSINNTALTIDQGSTLNVGGSFTTSNTGATTVTINGDMIVGNGVSSIDADWIVGSTGNLDITGNFINDTGGTSFDIDGSVSVSGNTQFHSGLFEINSGGSFESSGTNLLIGGATITNNGSMNFPNMNNLDGWNAGGFDCDGSGSGTVGFGAGAYCAGACGAGQTGNCVDNGTPLPIELSYFSASLNNSFFEFEWETIMEENNDFFTIEYSSNLNDFKSLLETNGAGNSLSPITYHESVPAFSFEDILYFRLKQTDYDGHYSHSQLVAISNNGDFNSELKIYPNPTESNTLIQLSNINTETLTGYVLSPSTLKKVGEFEIQNGQAVIDFSYLDNGVYFLNVIGLSSSPFKLVIQK